MEKKGKHLNADNFNMGAKKPSRVDELELENSELKEEIKVLESNYENISNMFQDSVKKNVQLEEENAALRKATDDSGADSGTSTEASSESTESTGQSAGSDGDGDTRSGDGSTGDGGVQTDTDGDAVGSSDGETDDTHQDSRGARDNGKSSKKSPAKSGANKPR